MNGRERIMTALNRGQADRVPVWEMAFNNEPLFGIAAHYTDVKKLPQPKGINALIVIARELDLDGITAMTSAPWEQVDGPYLKDALGVVYRRSEHGAPYPVDGPIKEPADLKGFRMRQPQDSDFMMLDILRSEFPDRAIAFHMPATFKLSWSLMGSMEELFLKYILDPDFVQEMARLVTDYCLEIVDVAFKKGADFIACEGDLAQNQGSIMSPAHYDEYIGPYHKELCDRVHQNDGKIIKHSDGNLTPLIPALLDAGFDGIHPIQPQNMDIGETKREFGGQACILGNIDCSFLLVFDTPEDVRKSVKETITAAAPGGGYIISSSNSIHPGCKPENYIAMVEAAHEYGQY
jgi:uroporphyrinogen decarboxylase